MLITHEHPDHLDADALRSAAQSNRSLRVWAPAVVAEALSDLGDRVTAVAPGDSFIVATEPVQTLLLPTNAPWSKASEVIDFAIAVRAAQAFQIHDSLITNVYAGLVEGHLNRIAGAFGLEFRRLNPADSVTV